MTWYHVLASRLRAVFSAHRLDRDLDEELRSHIEMQTEANLRRGMSPEEAHRRALLEFGGLTQTREIYRERRGLPWLETLARDVRYALRTMGRNRGFTAVAVLSLALGIGANTAFFSVMNVMLLQPLPVKNPQELVEFTRLHPTGARMTNLPYAVFLRFQQNHTSLMGVFAVRRVSGIFVDGGIAEPGVVQQVSGSFFTTLAVPALAGRTISSEDDRPGSAKPVAVLSYAFWSRRFGRDPAALGKIVLFEGQRLTIIGVMPPEFFGTDRSQPPDLWQPLALNPKPFEVWVLGRLRPDVSIMAARRDLEPLFRQALAEDDRPETDRDREEFLAQKLGVSRATSGTIGNRWQYWEYSSKSKLLLGLTGVVLLIACVNLASLLMARSLARSREVAVRLALGAGRGRLIRQFMTESLLMSLAGGAVGILCASWGHGIVMGFLGRDPRARLADFQIDYRILSFGFALSIATAFVFGLFPAIQATRGGRASEIQSVGRQIRGTRLPLARTLLVVQVALSLVLMIAAGLSARSLDNLSAANFGFERERLIVVNVDFAAHRPAQDFPASWRHATDRLSAFPGVESLALAADGVVSTRNFTKTFRLQRQPPEDVQVAVNVVDRAFFATVGMPLLGGREFGEQDRVASPRVAIVNETFARRYFGGRNPVGERVGNTGARGGYQIVGVVGDVPSGNLHSPARPTIYQASSQEPPERLEVLHIRTAVDPASLLPTIRRELANVGGGILISEPKTFSRVVRDELGQDRLFTIVASLFALLALVLAGIGVYGAVAFRVATRSGEIGIRLALGARRIDVVWLVVGELLLVFGAGVIIGAPATAVVGRLMKGVLFGVAPWDPTTLTAGIAMLFLASVVAAYSPARRATRIDPVKWLHYE